MLFAILAATGTVGAILLGVDAQSVVGSARELEQIFASMAVFLAAAGLVGMLVDEGSRPKTPRPFLSTGDAIMLAVATPILLLSTGVFLLTLLPAIYLVLVPVALGVIRERHRPARTMVAPTAEIPTFASDFRGAHARS